MGTFLLIPWNQQITYQTHKIKKNTARNTVNQADVRQQLTTIKFKEWVLNVFNRILTTKQISIPQYLNRLGI